ncbi:MAG: hypothetical protein AB1656_14675 [Candidatus Omnitrophota bacterium]
MYQFPFQLFHPTQSLEAVFPFLIGFTFAVIAVFLLWIIIDYILFRRSATKELRLFYSLAHRFHLSNREANYLKLAASKNNIHPLSRILTEQDRFERAVFSMYKKFRRLMIQNIREKLFGYRLKPAETIHSTKQLPPGSRLLLKYIQYPDALLWGHLIDVDKMGLIVVIPSYYEIHIPLRPNTLLEITAYIPEHDPVEFRSWVKSVIPGPRKMIVIGHSDFVLRAEETEGDLLFGPQNHLKKYPALSSSSSAPHDSPLRFRSRSVKNPKFIMSL